MDNQKLKVIDGQRDQIERELVDLLIKPASHTQSDKDRLNDLGQKLTVRGNLKAI